MSALLRRCQPAALLWLALTCASPAGVRAETTPAAAADVDEAKARFKAGKDLYEKGDYAKALTEFEAGYLLTRNSAFLVNIGVCHKKLGRKEEALENFKSFLEQDPSSPRKAEVEAHIAELGGLAQLDKKKTQPREAPATDDPAYVAPVKPAAAPAPIVIEDSGAITRVPPVKASIAQAEASSDDDGEPLLSTSRSSRGRSRPAATTTRRAPAHTDTDEDEPTDEPFYQKGWFWGVVGAAVVGGVVAAFLLGGSSQQSGTLGTIDARGQ